MSLHIAYLLPKFFSDSSRSFRRVCSIRREQWTITTYVRKEKYVTRDYKIERKKEKERERERERKITHDKIIFISCDLERPILNIVTFTCWDFLNKPKHKLHERIITHVTYFRLY
jgi:hypothetical protein